MASKTSKADLEVTHRYQDYSKIANKENILPFIPQLYDRIKQDPRKATKRPPCFGSKESRSAVQQTTSQLTTANMAGSTPQLAPLQVRTPAPIIDWTNSPTPASDTASSDRTYQGTAEKYDIQFGPQSSSGDVNNNSPPKGRPSWSSKRSADPECSSQPPAKRSRSLPGPPDQKVSERVDEPLRKSVEGAATQGHAVATTTRAPELWQDEEANRSGSSVSPLRSPKPPLTLALQDFRDRAYQDAEFMSKVHMSLLKQSKRKTANVGKRQARRILEILRLAKSPDAFEALFVSGEDAKAHLQANKYFPGPIITEGQQSLELQTIEDFLAELYDNDAKVWIQDPGVKLTDKVQSTREINIGKLKEQFQKDRVSVPYNCLELAAHVEDGLRPAFLNTEDCRLLTKLKHPSSGDQASRRKYEPGWKEVEKWALLAKAGALTEPHQDSHGYSTYITVNQGIIGFGWLANPTDSQRAAWRKDPATFVEGEWRYVVLRPGQTVYFPSGTVHFVFRHSSEGDTLAFGGHVLRCSQILRWVRTLLEEKATASQLTNEDLSESAPGYLQRVEKFVGQATEKGQVEKWGGEEAVEEFLRLKGEFLGEEVEVTGDGERGDQVDRDGIAL